MTGGLYGLNVRTIGVSRDMILAAQARINGAFLLAQDDPELAAAASAQGAFVIYRQSGDGQGGSNPLSVDPMSFLRERAKNAPGAAYLHATNELDPSDDLHRWTKELLSAARDLKRKVVIYNHSTHKSAAQWQSCAANITQAVADGCAVGWHAYLDAEHDGTAFEFLALKRQVGGLWIGTEFAFARSYTDSARGWRGVTNPDNRRAFLATWVRFLDAERMPVVLFCYDPWDKPTVESAKAEGFGFWDYPDVLDAMADLNAAHPFKGASMPVTPPTPLGDPFFTFVAYPAGLNLRAAPTTQAAILRKIPKGEAVTVYLSPRTVANGYTFVWLTDTQGNAGYGALAVNGLLGFNPPVPAEAVTPVPPIWTDVLNVPYVSQTDANADRTQNDCGLASLAMLCRYRLWQYTGLVADLPSVDDLAPYTPLLSSNPPQGLTFSQLIQLARRLGFNAEYRQMQKPLIIDALERSVPIMALVNYAVYNPKDSFKGAHLCVLIGFNETHVLTHDPFHGGRDYVITWRNLEEAMRSVPGNSGSFQTLALV